MGPPSYLRSVVDWNVLCSAWLYVESRNSLASNEMTVPYYYVQSTEDESQRNGSGLFKSTSPVLVSIDKTKTTKRLLVWEVRFRNCNRPDILQVPLYSSFRFR